MVTSLAHNDWDWSKPERVLAEVDLAHFLNEYKKGETTTTYSIRHLGLASTLSSQIFMDSFKGISLSVKGRAFNYQLALLGYKFLKTKEEKIPIVVQMQSRRLSDIVLGREYLSNLSKDLKWERMLVSIFEDLARRMRKTKVGILPAERTRFYERRYQEEKESEPIEVHRNRLKLRYDGTARRMGYKYDKDNELYLKALD